MNAKRTVALGMLLGLSLGVGGWCQSQEPKGQEPKPVSPLATPGSANEPVPAPEFTGVTEWINTKPLKLADQKGKVVVVHFWTNGCINCIHNYPHYKAWQEKYKDEKNLVIIGVHTPEVESEKNIDQIKDRMAKNKLTFAVAVDNDAANWKAWGNNWWPTVYLVDKNGVARQRWASELGEGGYKNMTAKIDELLAEKVKEK